MGDLSMELFGDIIGHTAVILFLTAYFLLQKGTWKSDSVWYLGCNFTGAVLILGSLWVDWNLSAFLLEAAWALISMWGLIKIYRRRTS